MQFITIDQARDHCKSDSADDTMLTVYANAAEKAVAKMANRNIYATQGALDAALGGVVASMVAANATYTAALTAAAAIDIEADKLFATRPSPTFPAEAIITQINEERFIVLM